MGRQDDLVTVKNLDLERYMGRWYQIANIPSRFQPKGGVNTRATYTLKPDGSVNVLNETWLDGKRSYIEGSAWKADPKSPDAKILVRFWVPPFLPVFPVTGDYWVMALDEDYQWALVGQPSRRYLWILSRKPALEEETYCKLVELAKEQGYDVDTLQKTNHVEGAEDQTVEDKGSWWFKSLLGK